MNDQNKINFLQGSVVLLAFIAILFGIMCFVSARWWMIPVPAAALGHGVYCFVRDYYPKNKEEKK